MKYINEFIKDELLCHGADYVAFGDLSALSPDVARKSVNAVKGNVANANAVGDLASLSTRLDALADKVAELAVARKAERAVQQEA